MNDSQAVSRQPLRMTYEKTVLVDFDLLTQGNVPSHEVPFTGAYVHKPLRNQGRFGSNHERYFQGVEARAD